MRLTALVLCLALPAWAQDGGVVERAKFYKVPENARITVGFGESQDLPAGYFLTELSFQILNREMKRLQDLQRVQEDTKLSVPLQAYLIGASIVAAVFSIGGIVLGWYLWGRK